MTCAKSATLVTDILFVARMVSSLRTASISITGISDDIAPSTFALRKPHSTITASGDRAFTCTALISWGEIWSTVRSGAARKLSTIPISQADVVQVMMHFARLLTIVRCFDWSLD